MGEEHLARRRNAEKPGGGSRGGRAQERWAGLRARQAVLPETGGARPPPPRLLLAGKPALDQACDDRADAEGTLHQRRFGEPRFQIIAEHILAEQCRQRKLAALDLLCDVSESPNRKRI